MSLLEIEGGLGYWTANIDAWVAEPYASIQPGDYTRVCALLEQTAYGDILPQPFEKRTIQTFLQKLLRGDERMNLYTRGRLRYACLTFKKRKKLKNRHNFIPKYSSMCYNGKQLCSHNGFEGNREEKNVNNY